VTDNNGCIYNVGLDCADTLSLCDIKQYFVYEQKKKELRNFKSNISKVKKMFKE
jgi:hypothetical protein